MEETPLVDNLVGGWRFAVSFTFWPLYFCKEPLVAILLEAVWHSDHKGIVVLPAGNLFMYLYFI
jgi:hypothetical protein